MKQRIPCTVLSGYLGSGKTTALNHLLKHAQGPRIAVLVNDFGKINIDADLIESKDDQTISLSNGCVCCTIADDLGGALSEQVERANPPDHIVIESSGVADAVRISQHVAGWPCIELSGVITMVDAAHFEERSQDKYVGSMVRRQVAAADTLVINKMDLCSDGELKKLEQNLHRLNDEADFVSISWGRIAPSLFLSPKLARSLSLDLADDVHGVLRGLWIPDGPLDRNKLDACLSNLPSNVHRLKGFVQDLATKKTLLVQMVGTEKISEEFDLKGKNLPAGLVYLVTPDDKSLSDIADLLDAM